MDKTFLNSIYGQILNDIIESELNDVIESENNDTLRSAVQEFIDSTTGLKPVTPYMKRIWMQAAANHVALQCRNLPDKAKNDMIDDFRKLLFAE